MRASSAPPTRHPGRQAHVAHNEPIERVASDPDDLPQIRETLTVSTVLDTRLGQHSSLGRHGELHFPVRR